MTDKTYNILFLCTGNSARSIMAEALVTTMSRGRFKGFSAGSQPSGKVNPLAIEKIKEIDYPIDSLRSKSWDEFSLAAAPKMDFIITVCDNVAGETCPFWPGQPISAHWSFEDPAATDGTDEQKRVAVNKIFRQIVARMNTFFALPIEKLEKNAIQHEMKTIGDTLVNDA